MAKQIFRKPTPSPPPYFWYDTDGCWMCHIKGRGCRSCSFLKRYVHNQKERQERKEKQQLKRFLEEEESARMG